MNRLEKYVLSFNDDKCTQVSDSFCYQLWASLQYVFDHDQKMFKEAFKAGMRDKKELIEWRDELNKKLCKKQNNGRTIKI